MTNACVNVCSPIERVHALTVCSAASFSECRECTHLLMGHLHRRRSHPYFLAAHIGYMDIHVLHSEKVWVSRWSSHLSVTWDMLYCNILKTSAWIVQPLLEKGYSCQDRRARLRMFCTKLFWVMSKLYLVTLVESIVKVYAERLKWLIWGILLYKKWKL